MTQMGDLLTALETFAAVWLVVGVLVTVMTKCHIASIKPFMVVWEGYVKAQ